MSMSDERLAYLRDYAAQEGEFRLRSAVDEIERLRAEADRLKRRDTALSEVVRVWLVEVEEYDQNWHQCSCLWLPDRDWDPVHRCASVDGAFLIGIDPKGQPTVDEDLSPEPTP